MQAAESLLARDPENFASVAGLAKGTVYLYFKTKEEMLMAIHAEQAARLSSVIRFGAHLFWRSIYNALRLDYCAAPHLLEPVHD